VQTDFIHFLKLRMARGAVTASAAQSMGKGTCGAARTYLAAMPLKDFVRSRRPGFETALNDHTDGLAEALPGRQWGSARKFLNIYLRNRLYNRYAQEILDLTSIESWLEVPLDSHVGDGLNLYEQLARSHGVKAWKSVVGLTSESSAAFQALAQAVADHHYSGIARVHLDVILQNGDHVKRRR
jgi:hypothetical protein